jgi:hypothetical protein
VYSKTYTYNGRIRAFGGTGAETNSNAAAGTIYLSTGSSGRAYQLLIINNNNLATNEQHRTLLSDTVPSNSSMKYFFDEINLGGAANFALKVANSDNALRTVVQIAKLSGDGTGVLHALANTQVNMTGEAIFLNSSSIYVYPQGVAILPPSVTVGRTNTIRCQGRLFGISSLTLSQYGTASFYTTCSSLAHIFSNTFKLSTLSLNGSSSLSLIHDKNVSTFFFLNVTNQVSLNDSSTIYVTGLAKLETPVLNLVSTNSEIKANGAGFTEAMTNLFCPQNAGQQGICYMHCFNEL